MRQRIAVVGGSGRMGVRMVQALREAGATAAPLSRRTGFDLAGSDPDALARALEGFDAVVDCSDAADHRRATFETSAKALSRAATRAGVGQLVVVSIIGIDRPGLARMGYYQGKLAQERALATGPVPVTVVRSTQWYGFADQVYVALPLGRRRRMGLAPAMRMQPVADGAVAARLARAAMESPGSARIELAGAGPMSVADLARRVWRARGVRARVAALPIPGLPGFTDGSLLPGPDAELDQTTVEEWVETEGLSRPAG